MPTIKEIKDMVSSIPEGTTEQKSLVMLTDLNSQLFQELQETRAELRETRLHWTVCKG